MSSHHLPLQKILYLDRNYRGSVSTGCSSEGLGIDTGLPVLGYWRGMYPPLLGAILGPSVEGNADRARFVQFGYAGLLLLLIFGVCTVIIFAAQALSLVLEGQAADWIPLTGSGFIWASIIALPLFPRIKKILFGCSQGECCCE